MRNSTIQPPIGTQLNRSHPLTKGLVANWLLNEGGGLLAFDSTSLSNIPGSSNAVSKQTVRGNAVLFNGTTNRITLGTQSSLNLTGAMSITAWVNTNVISNALREIVADSNLAGSALQWALGVNRSPGKFEFVHGGSIILTATATIVANTWYNVGVSRSGSTGSWAVKIYINGVLDSSTSGNTNNPAAQQGAAIGQSGLRALLFFSGLINDIKIYNRTLSDSEFMQLYTNPYQMFVNKVR